jgi:hypothetical protein
VSNRLRTRLPLWAAGALVLAAGCKERPYPIKFNNTMARSNRELATAAKEFQAVLRKQPIDPKEVENKYQQMAAKLKDIVEKFDDIGSPMGTAYGSELLDRYLDFLKAEQTIVNTHAKQIVDIAKAGGDQQAIDALLARIGEEEGPKLTALKETQKKFADDLKLKLEGG